jgi:hypothetical protein
VADERGAHADRERDAAEPAHDERQPPQCEPRALEDDEVTHEPGERDVVRERADDDEEQERERVR